MYSQLAQQTQTIYRSEQEKARQVATLREEVAQKDNLLGRAKGLCGKLLSFRRKSRLDTAAQQETAASIQLAREEAKAEAKAELQQVKEAADYYRTKWYESLVSAEQYVHGKCACKCAYASLSTALLGQCCSKKHTWSFSTMQCCLGADLPTLWPHGQYHTCHC